ncbi:MAG: NADH-quinone oxidoreductase subunit C [Eggerthellaceae bacterium]|nr:NADH-quinone oxidoreductase subunit C [Eggerthellaceae bacterium]
MNYSTEFKAIPFESLTQEVGERKAQGWRYVQTLAVNCDPGIDLIYSFMNMETGLLENLKVEKLEKGTHAPSISDLYLEAFVWENEIHDLFGINFDGIAIDFHGAFYALSTPEPMTVISPAQKEAKEKAAKIAAAKAAKEAKAKGESAPAAADDMEAKLAGMDPEKAAKVRAAMEAKAKKEKAAAEAAEAAALEEKLAGMDPEKAAKVRAAMEAKAKKAAAKKEEN